jgi:hypothetical protein
VIFRIIAALMAALLAYAAVLNFNDPDPVRWIAIYGVACLVSILAAATGAVPIAAPAAIALVALVWGATLAARVPNIDVYTHMFDEWEMKSSQVEEAREACGLFIVGVWMAVVAAVLWRGAR